MHQIPMLELVLDGRAGSVRAARRAVERFFDELTAGAGPRFRADTRLDTTLVVAELVANACRHAPGPCRLMVSAQVGAVEVAVEDTSPRLLATPAPQPGGYGLLVVTRLTRGIHVVTVPGGKIVEATVLER